MSDNANREITKDTELSWEELYRKLVRKLVSAFPATPKLTYPDPGGYWWVYPFIGAPVRVRTNRTDVRHVLKVTDLTDAANVIPDQVFTPPLFNDFYPYVDEVYVISGHDYRIRIEIHPGDAGANDEFDTVYVTT